MVLRMLGGQSRVGGQRRRWPRGLVHQDADPFGLAGDPTLRDDRLGEAQRGAADARDPRPRADPSRVVQLGPEIDGEACDDEEHARRQRGVQLAGEEVDAAGFAEDGEGRVVDVPVGVRVGIAQDVLDPEHAAVLRRTAEPAGFGQQLVGDGLADAGRPDQFAATQLPKALRTVCWEETAMVMDGSVAEACAMKLEP